LVDLGAAPRRDTDKKRTVTERQIRYNP
jgi:hypothetical protein